MYYRVLYLSFLVMYICVIIEKKKKIINTAAEYKRALHETDFTLVSDEFKSNDSLRNLFYAAADIRSEIERCNGIDIFPLKPRDISQEKAESVLPRKLTLFLYWLCKKSDNIEVSQKSHKYTKIVSVAQDIASKYLYKW